MSEETDLSPLAQDLEAMVQQLRRLSPAQEITARLTSGSGIGPYTFVQLVAVPGGGWTEGPITDEEGEHPAYNTVDETPGLPCNVRLAWMPDSSAWAFTMGGCR